MKNTAGWFGIAVFLLLVLFGIVAKDGASITLGIVFAVMCWRSMRT